MRHTELQRICLKLKVQIWPFNGVTSYKSTKAHYPLGSVLSDGYSVIRPLNNLGQLSELNLVQIGAAKKTKSDWSTEMVNALLFHFLRVPDCLSSKTSKC